MGYGGGVKDPEFVGLLFWAAVVVRLGRFFFFASRRVGSIFSVICTHARTHDDGTRTGGGWGPASRPVSGGAPLTGR